MTLETPGAQSHVSDITVTLKSSHFKLVRFVMAASVRNIFRKQHPRTLNTEPYLNHKPVETVFDGISKLTQYSLFFFQLVGKNLPSENDYESLWGRRRTSEAIAPQCARQAVLTPKIKTLIKSEPPSMEVPCCPHLLYFLF